MLLWVTNKCLHCWPANKDPYANNFIAWGWDKYHIFYLTHLLGTNTLVVKAQFIKQLIWRENLALVAIDSQGKMPAL